MNEVIKYFINDEEVPLERFKYEYDILLKIWLLQIGDDPEVTYENETNFMFNHNYPFSSISTKLFNTEFKVVKEKVNILSYAYETVEIPAGMPVRDDAGKIIGVTNGDGSISITDPEFIKIITELKTKPLSVSYYKEVIK